MRLRRLLQQSWPWQWWRAGRALLRGVRLHPSAVLLGEIGRFDFGRGSVIGARVRVDSGNAGRLVTGQDVWLAAETEIEITTVVRVGSGTTIQRRSSINGSVRIGRGCILAPNVFVSSGTHPFRTIAHLPIREQERSISRLPGGKEALDRPVWIQDDCWLGINAVVCAGVTVGKGSVVGANAVVTRDVAPYSVVGGTPARVLGRRLDWHPSERILTNRTEDLVYVLSGAPVHEGDRQVAVAVTPDDPLVAVVAATANRVALRYRALADLEIQAGGVRQMLEAGDGVIEFPVFAGPHGFEGSILELTMTALDTRSALHIYQIERA